MTFALVTMSYATQGHLVEVLWIQNIHECSNEQIATPEQCNEHAIESNTEFEAATQYDRPLGCYRYVTTLFGVSRK